jgi:zinc and cadmium transporter
VNALVFALAAAAANLAGGYAVVRHERHSLAVIDLLLAFGAGFMLSVVVLEMAPEAILMRSDAPLYILGGYFTVHLAQHVLVPHFHFGEETHRVGPHLGLTVLVGLLIHTFFDGVAIASGFLVSDQLGLLLFLAVFFHKLPEGLTMASVVLAGGQGRARALGAAGLLGVATVLGVILTEYSTPLVDHGLAISAGVTFYVAASNLVPEFQARRGWRMPVAFFGGAVVFFVSRMLMEGLGTR